MRVNGKIIICAFLLVASTITVALQGQSASATQITARSLTLKAGATDGGSKPSGVVNHLFGFTIPTNNSTIGSIKFQYCKLAAGACDTPDGLLTTAATLFDEDNTVSGFSIVKDTNGSPYITRAAVQAAGTPSVTYELANITNPSTINTTFFVRISTYASIDTTGSPIDEGTVAATTARQIILTGVMPESLIFCTGATIGLNVGGVPDCTTASSGAVAFNQLFSPTDTATATSQMSASTNATGGYSITVNGGTLTEGSTPIAAMGTKAPGARGVSQFGMNLKLNTTLTSTAAVGLEVDDPSNGSDLRGKAAVGYDTVDQFKFTTGDVVANSSFNTPGPTNAQIFTTSYIVNVPGSQTAGTYTTTLTYICTPTF